MFYLVYTIIALLIFFWLHKEKRSLSLALSLNLAVLGFALFIQKFASSLVLNLIFSLYFIFPLLANLVYSSAEAMNEIKLHKGFKASLENFSYMFLQVLAIVYFLGINLGNVSSVVMKLFWLIDFALIILFHSYYLATKFNQTKDLKQDLDYIIVLGARLNEKGEVGGQLKQRLDKALELKQANPHSKIIVSGGKKWCGQIIEAEAMAKYLEAASVPKDEIILETKSNFTKQNILFSFENIEKGAKTAIVTSDYHLLRALIISRNLGFEAIGVAAKADTSRSAYIFLTEFIKYLFRDYKFGLFFTIMALFLAFINHF